MLLYGKLNKKQLCKNIFYMFKDLKIVELE